MSDLLHAPGFGPGSNPVPDVDSSLAEVGPSRSLAGDAWKRFRRNRLAMFGLVLVLVLAIVSLVGPLLVQDPLFTGGLSREAPTNQHLMGTDELGRDVMARVVYGIRLSLFIGIVVTIIETVIGIVVGAVAGWRRGWVDSVLMRIVDVLLGIPYLVLALAMVTVIGKGVPAGILPLAITAWLQTPRHARGRFPAAPRTKPPEAGNAAGG